MFGIHELHFKKRREVMELVWEKEEDQRLLKTVSTSPFVVIEGQPLCITRGFDKLAKRAGRVMKQVKTPVEILDRPMKLVSVSKYYPRLQRYEDIGEFWADTATGTLYNRFDGKCLSSDMLELVL
jgi:hypothetical protein